MKPWVVTVEGKIYDVDAPDETTAWRWANQTHASFKEAIRSKMIPPFEMEARNPASGYNTGEQFFAGMGKGMTDVARGAGQLMGSGPTRAEMDVIKARDKSLLGSGFGAAGNVAGNMAIATPAMLVPGSQTIGGGALIGSSLGAGQPVGTEDSRFKNTLIGGAIGGAVPAAIKGIIAAGGVARNLVDPLLPGGIERSVGRTGLRAAGDKTDEIVRLLRQQKEHVPGSIPIAGEAAAPAGRAEFSALQAAVQSRLPSQYGARTDEQNIARLHELGTVAKDSDAFAAAKQLRDTNAQQNYGAVRHDLIDPRSEAKIMQDAIGAKGGAASQSVEDVRRLELAKQLAEQNAQNWFPVQGQPRVPGRYSYPEELAGIAERKSGEAAASSLQSGVERRYLEDFRRMLGEAGNLNTKSLDQFLSRPSVQDAVQKALLGAKETGGYFPQAGEQFSVGNLQRIKMAIADELDKPEVAKALGKTERAEIGGTLNQFVKWLSDKSPGWKAARLQFAEDSVPMNRMQVGQYLESILKPSGWQAGAGGQPLNVKGYIEALRKGSDVGDTTAARRAAELIQNRATGSARYGELPEAMGTQMEPLNAIKVDLLRSEAHKGLAKTGIPRARELLGQILPEVPAAGMFNPKYSVVRAILNRLSGKLEGKSIDRLAEAMLNPQEMARLMENATPQQSRMIAELLRSAQIPITAGAIQGAQ